MAEPTRTMGPPTRSRNLPNHKLPSTSKLPLLLLLWICSLQCITLHKVYNRHLFQGDGEKKYTVPSAAIIANSGKPLGVFVMKVQHVHEVLRSVCILDLFFNHERKYAIRIFADEVPTSETIVQELQRINPFVDLQVILDHEQRSKQFPRELSEVEQAELRTNCTVDRCTTRQVRMGYVYMGYWRYRLMAYEPSLKGFDYFISWDTDAYLTQPLEVDPFLVLQQNNLTGFYLTDFHSDQYDQGVEEAAHRVYGNSTTGRGYLDSQDTFPFFNQHGKSTHRSIYGYVFGGRLDFFRSPTFREFSRLIVPFTYKFRVDEQVVIAKAWSMMAPNHVWHLPTHGYRLGVYHHSFVDDYQLVDCDKASPPEAATVQNNSDVGFCYWINQMLSGEHPVVFQYPGYFWLDWVNYNKLVRSLSAKTRNDHNSSVVMGFSACSCLATKGSPSGGSDSCGDRVALK